MNKILLGRGKFAIVLVLMGSVLAVGAIPARAGLGADAGTIPSDAAAMAGAMSPPAPSAEEQPTAAYSMKSFVTGKGTTVREYSAPNGAVFGVAWEGRKPPDLSVLLGSYYPEYVAAAASQRGPVGLHHSAVATTHSRVFMSGHMGHLVGRAYVPSLVPAGLDPRAVVK